MFITDWQERGSILCNECVVCLNAVNQLPLFTVQLTKIFGSYKCVVFANEQRIRCFELITATQVECIKDAFDYIQQQFDSFRNARAELFIRQMDAASET